MSCYNRNYRLDQFNPEYPRWLDRAGLMDSGLFKQ